MPSCWWQGDRFGEGIMVRLPFWNDYHCSTIDTQGKWKVERPKENLTTWPADVIWFPEVFGTSRYYKKCLTVEEWPAGCGSCQGWRKIKQCSGGRSLCFEVKDKSFYKVQALCRTEILRSRVPTRNHRSGNRLLLFRREGDKQKSCHYCCRW